MLPKKTLFWVGLWSRVRLCERVSSLKKKQKKKSNED